MQPGRNPNATIKFRMHHADPVDIDTTPEFVSGVYQKLRENVARYRDVVQRPLTLAEKILAGHHDHAYIQGAVGITPQRQSKPPV